MPVTEVEVSRRKALDALEVLQDPADLYKIDGKLTFAIKRQQGGAIDEPRLEDTIPAHFLHFNSKEDGALGAAQEIERILISEGATKGVDYWVADKDNSIDVDGNHITNPDYIWIRFDDQYRAALQGQLTAELNGDGGVPWFTLDKMKIRVSTIKAGQAPPGEALVYDALEVDIMAKSQPKSEAAVEQVEHRARMLDDCIKLAVRAAGFSLHANSRNDKYGTRHITLTPLPSGDGQGGKRAVAPSEIEEVINNTIHKIFGEIAAEKRKLGRNDEHAFSNAADTVQRAIGTPRRRGFVERVAGNEVPDRNITEAAAGVDRGATKPESFAEVEDVKAETNRDEQYLTTLQVRGAVGEVLVGLEPFNAVINNTIDTIMNAIGSSACPREPDSEARTSPSPENFLPTTFANIALKRIILESMAGKAETIPESARKSAASRIVNKLHELREKKTEAQL